jgi:hypothetical protein
MRLDLWVASMVLAGYSGTGCKDLLLDPLKAIHTHEDAGELKLVAWNQCKWKGSSLEGLTSAV